MCGPFELESLEYRKHLSATLSSRGILYVVGTQHSDAITFELERRHSGVLDVTINGSAVRFYTGSVKQIILEGSRGKDKIIFDDRYGKIPGQPEHRNNRRGENDDFVTDDGTDLIEVVDDSDTTTDDGSTDDTSPPPDDSISTTQPTTQPTTDPTTQPTDPSGDDSDSGDDGSPTD